MGKAYSAFSLMRSDFDFDLKSTYFECHKSCLNQFFELSDTCFLRVFRNTSGIADHLR